jgi:hypothetical protein
VILEVSVRRLPALCLALSIVPGAAPARGEDAVAIVARLAGRATVRNRGGEAREARLFDWLPAGAAVETAPASSLTLAFAGGQRHEMGPSATATLGPDGLAASSGPVTALAPLPPLPSIPPLAPDARPGTRAAALRIRGPRIQGLYPRGDAAVLSDGAVLRFAPAPGAASYRVEVEDDEGVVVFRVEVAAPPVQVSPGVLEPGARYSWVVRTLRGSRPPALGAAEFVTLAAEVVERRAALRRALGTEDPASSSLLAEIDRELGLLVEARDTFRSALAAAPDDDRIREALLRVEAALAEPPGEP